MQKYKLQNNCHKLLLKAIIGNIQTFNEIDVLGIEGVEYRKLNNKFEDTEHLKKNLGLIRYYIK